jgi:KDO2-lipid IV(A) lauroyltransferase
VAKKKPYRFFLYLAARLFAAFLSLLPRSWTLALARLAGRIAYRTVGRQRERALENLRSAFGREKSEAEIRALAEKVFEHFAQTAAELPHFPRLSREKISHFVEAGDAFRIYDSLLARGRGVIMLTSHIGCWDLLAGVFGLKGYRGSAVARRIYYEPYNHWVVDLRRRLGVGTVYHDEPTQKILDVLQRNEILGLLPDQDIDRVKGVFVDFFGRPAYTMTAPARIALSTGAPIIPTFLIREPGDRYRVVLGEVIHPTLTATRVEAIRSITAAWMASVEKVIRAWPEQWAWMHNRWRTQPAKNQNPEFQKESVA